jgi:hypothetical protein
MSQLLERHHEVLPGLLKLDVESDTIPIPVIYVLPDTVIDLGGHALVKVLAGQTLHHSQGIGLSQLLQWQRNFTEVTGARVRLQSIRQEGIAL